MIRRILFFVIGLLFLACSSQSFSDELSFSDPYDLSVTLKNMEITSAQNCVIEIRISYSDEFFPQIPNWIEVFSPLEILSILESGSVNRENTHYTKIFILTLKQLVPGDYILKPVEIDFLKNGEKFSMASDYLDLRVTSTMIGDGVFIDDFERGKTNRWPIILFASIISIFGTAIIVYLRKRKVSGQKKTSGESKNYLDLIENISEEGDDKLFYESLSLLLKEYLDQNILLSVQSLTTEELVELFRSETTLDSELKEKIISILKCCDMSLFSSRKTNPDEKKNQKEMTLEIIEKIHSHIRKEYSV